MNPDLKSKILDLEEHFNEGFIKEFEVIDGFFFHLKSVNYDLKYYFMPYSLNVVFVFHLIHSFTRNNIDYNIIDIL